MLAETSLFTIFFWIAFVASIAQLALAYRAGKRMKANTIGKQANGQPATFRNFEFYFLELTSLFYETLYEPIIKQLLDAFSCQEVDGTIVLKSEESIVCFEGVHVMYFVLAIVGIVIYYPTATFLSPNIQFLDASLDLKFEPQFVVWMAQAKLIIGSMASFFDHTQGTLPLQLSIAGCITAFLALDVLRTQPCVLETVNIWLGGGLWIATFINFSSIFSNYYDSARTAIYIAQGIAIVVTLSFCLYVHHRKDKLKVFGQVADWVQRKICCKKDISLQAQLAMAKEASVAEGVTEGVP